MSAEEKPCTSFSGQDTRLDKTTGEIIPLKPSNRRVFKFGMTSNLNEAGPGTYEAKCIKVDLDAHFKSVPKIMLHFEITEGYETGKVTRIFCNNPGAKSGIIGDGAKLYEIVDKLYPKLLIDGEAEIDIVSLFENKVFQITVIEVPKKNGRGFTRKVTEIKHPDTGF